MVGYDLNNTAYFGYVDDWSSIRLRSSADNGAHWSNQKVVDIEGSGLYSTWLAVDTGRTSQFQNRLYISSIHGGVNSVATRIHVSFSGDGKHWVGKFLGNWQYPSIDASPHLSLGSDGTAYATWIRCRNDGPNHDCGDTVVPIFFSKSADGGNTWSTPTIVSRTRLTPTIGCAFGYGCLPSTTAGLANTPLTATVGDGASARLYVVFYNWTGTQMQVEVATSTDGGASFGTPVRVSNSNFGDQFNAWVSISEGGTLAVTWLDRRNDPANTKYQPFFATSRDGTKFSLSRALSDQLFDAVLFNGSGIATGPNLWSGNNLYATWDDTNSGLARIELGGAQF